MKNLQKLGVGLVCLTLISTFGCSTTKKSTASATNSVKITTNSPAQTKAATTTPAATIASTTKPVGTGPFDGGFASEDPLLFNLFTMDTEDPITAIKAPVQLIDADMTFGGQFFATTSVNYIEVFCPSWGNNVGSLTLSLYNWKTDYATTIAGTVIKTQEYVDYADNTWLQILFATPIPAGEYLWVLGNAVDPDVGMWDVAEGPVNHTTDVINYASGEPIEAYHMFRLQYTKTPNITLIAPSN